ncbi:Catabolite control protein A [Anaerolineae bacterium]|nr:Catabolite control protein A [Anaerolineae bacterium]
MEIMSYKNRVTIKQVAKEAGVSAQTVSRVANNHPDVSAETRRQVQRIIDRMMYQPSHIARTLIQGKSCTLGVVGTGLEYFGPSRTLLGIERQAHSLGYTLHLTLIHAPETNDVEQVCRDLVSRHVDGVVWAVPQIGNNRDWLETGTVQLSVPIVFLSMESIPERSVVSVNNRKGGRLATQHLIAQGYRQIGLITGPSDWWEARQRRLGWEDALKEAGMTIDNSLVVEGDWMSASGERGLYQLLEQRPEIDAVFVSNDQMAVGALQAARHLGRQVPDQLGVVGFDNIPESAYFYPPLTSVAQDMIELGSCAVQVLCGLIDEGEQDKLSAPRTKLIEPQLIVRASSTRGP